GPADVATTAPRRLTGDSGKAVSYQSFYHSGDPADWLSRAVAGNPSRGGALPRAEAIFLLPLRARRYNVMLPEPERQSAAFGAGPEYASTTLHSIRAATGSPASGLTPDTRFGR
ncbi:triacylglycerol lipase, partial [Streptomyces rubellomurinus subsp. indigoferus]